MKKKTLPKKSLPPTKKSGKDEVKKQKPISNKIKSKKQATKSKPNDSDSSSSSGNESDSEHKSDIERKPKLKKLMKSIGRATKATDTKSDVKDLTVRKRMASLNASAMMAATYEVERQLDKCEEKMYKLNADTDELISPPKKAKDIKNEVLESKDVRKNFPFYYFYRFRFGCWGSVLPPPPPQHLI